MRVGKHPESIVKQNFHYTLVTVTSIRHTLIHTGVMVPNLLNIK